MKFLRNFTLIMIITFTLGIMQNSPVQADSMKKSFRPDKTMETKVSFDNLELTVPAGVVNVPMTVERDVDLNLNGFERPSGLKVISELYKFGPRGLKFLPDKPLVGRFKIDPTTLPLGASLSIVRLYYINQDTKKLEVVEEQQIDQETGILEAKIRHFSTYVTAITVIWNGDGVNPFYDYVHHGDEHVSVYNQLLSVVSPVISLPGRGGLDLNLSRTYCPANYIDNIRGNININPFSISPSWSWAETYFDPMNQVLYLKDGTSYNIPVIAAGWTTPPVTYDYGSVKFIACQFNYVIGGNGSTITDWASYIGEIRLNNGIRIDIDQNNTCETVTDIHGNQIRYNFSKSYPVYITPDLSNSFKYTTIYPSILSSITDSAGRVLKLNYANSGYTYNSMGVISIPMLTTVQYSGKTILSHTMDISGNETFTDTLNRSTKYIYNSGWKDNSGTRNNTFWINEIDYFNGIRSVYNHSGSLIFSHILYRPDSSNQTETYSKSGQNAIVINGTNKKNLYICHKYV